jgi:ATP-dependent exoDNAse (exonuclease V) beta subunit
MGRTKGRQPIFHLQKSHRPPIQRMNPTIEFITASAGSGKTHRLVEIVAEAITSGHARPQGIVATTFTVAAANELRERLSGKFFEAGRHQDAVLLRSGMIGTVHGICLELLGRFALQAGISPDIKILDQNQARILLSRAFADVLTEEDEATLHQLSSRLAQSDSQTYTDYFRAVIPEIVATARSNDIPPDALPAMGTASWEEMKVALPAPTGDDLERLLADAIKGALQSLDPDSTVKAVNKYRDLLCQSARSLENNTLNWAEWTKLGTEAPGTSKANAPIAAPVQEIASRLGEHPGFHADLEAYISMLFTIAGRLAGEFADLKRQSGAADFADLEKEALDLLTRSEEVRSILSTEIDLLVVDEFQDTSPIQLALFSRLAECSKRVVWVGDVKQAIYGFRGADPKLIVSAVARATKAGSLGKSWRSAPDLVTFVNELFTVPFAEHLGLPAEEVALKPHRAACPDAAPALRVAKVTSGVDKQKGGAKKLNKDQRHSPTADAIKALLDSGERIVDKASITLTDPIGTLRPVTPRDIAVLVRTRDNATALANELRARGIDVSLSTTGLLATPECQFALACLRVLVDKSDSLACAEVIALEAEHPPEEWLSDRLRYVQERGARAAGEPMPEWGTSGPITSPCLSELLAARDGIAQATHGPLALYDLAFAAADVPRIVSVWGPTQERAEQRLANISRLREYILEYQTSTRETCGAASINGLFNWLADLANDYGDSDAGDMCPVDPEIDAVHIGTYHSAKGLEWPVVFATDLDTSPRSRLFSLRVHSDTDLIDLANPLAGRSLRLWINPFGKSKPPLLDALHDSDVGRRAAKSAVEEDLRLLYVGLTRARDILVLVHDPAVSRDWLELANTKELLLAEDPATIPGDLAFPLGFSTYPYEPLVANHTAAAVIHVPARAATPTPRAPLVITPSSREANASATVAEIIEFGKALVVPPEVNARDFGDAMHRIIAAEIHHPAYPDRTSRAARLLGRWNLGQFFSPAQILGAIDLYRQWVDETFRPTRQFIEVPFTHATPSGQRASGFIDHLLITPEGPVILDHKIFPGPKAMWEETVLSYSGQLGLYQQVVSAGYPDAPVPTCWIHLVSSGAAARVLIPPPGAQVFPEKK